MAIQEQIQSQRQQIEQSMAALQSAQQKAKMRSEEELRGIQKGKRQVKDALTQRAERKATRELLTKGEEQVGQFEAGFEQEVASKAPEYGKESYVETEYQKAKKILDEKIERENQRIKDYEDKIAKAREKERQDRDYDAGDRIDRWEDDISEIRARISGYSKAYGDKATTIKNVNTGYAESLANYEEDYRSQRNRQQAEFRELKKKPEFTSQLATLGLAGKSFVSLSDYEQGVTKYNQNVAYLKQLGKWSEKIGIDNVPQFARDKLGIPTMPEGEKLVIEYKDSMPVVRGITSSAFQQSFTPEMYNKRIEEMNNNLQSKKTDILFDTSKKYKPFVGYQSIEPQKIERINDVTIPAEKSTFQKVRQFVSNVFTEKFRVTPSEVGSNIKQVGRDAVLGGSIALEYVKTVKDIGSVPVEISSKYSGGSYNPISVVKDVGGFLKEATESRLESERNLKEIEKLNRNYSLGKIGDEEYTQKYNQLVKNPYLSSISSSEAINLYGTEKQKASSQFIQKGIGIGGYAVPYLSSVYLAEDVYSGTKKIGQGDYLGGGIQTAVGVGGLTLKVFSAFKPVKPLSELIKPTPMTTAGKIWTGAKITAGAGVVGYVGYSTYKETGSVWATIGAVAGTVAVPLLVGGISRQITSRTARPEYGGKSEREVIRFFNKDLEVRKLLAEQSRQSQSLWRKQLRTMGKLDKAVAAQQVRYGVNIPVKSAQESYIKYGKVKTGSIGEQDIARRKISGLLGDTVESQALKTKDTRVLYQDITVSQRPKIEGLAAPSKRLQKLFPDLFQEKKIRQLQATIGVSDKRGGLFYSLSSRIDLATGKESKPELTKLSVFKKSVIAETFQTGRKSTRKVGSILVDVMPEARIKDTQVFLMSKPKILFKATSLSGETLELRETLVKSGITSRKPVKLSLGQFGEYVQSRTPKSVLNKRGAFFTTKDRTLELIKYSRPDGEEVKTITGTFGDDRTSTEIVQRIFRKFILKGTGTTEFIQPKKVDFVTPAIRQTKVKLSVDNIQQFGIKEQVTKTINEVVQKLEPPKVLVKTDLSTSIQSPKVFPAQSEFYGTGTYETTQFGLPVAGALSMNLQPESLQLENQVLIKDQILIKESAKIRERLGLLQPVIIKDSIKIQQIPSLKPITSIKPEIKVKDIQKIAQVLQVKQLQKLQVLQQIKTKQVTRQVIQRPTRLRTPAQIKPIKVVPLISVGLGKGKLQRLASKVDTDEFKVFVRKQDKDIELGTFGTKERARTELVKELRGTLRASGFVEKGGKKIKVSELGIVSPEFRIGKRDEFRLVQRKERRLGTRGETKEVQFFRKVKGSKL